MPGPPPYGRSSTVRCRSVVKSRGLSCSRATSPRSAARPTTPVSMTGSTSSGNNEITPKRYIGHSVVGRPVDDDEPEHEVDVLDDAADDERDQTLGRAVEHEHVVPAGREQVIHPAEHDAGRRPHFEPFEIRPIELAGRSRRKPLARHDDVGADELASPIAIVDAMQL